MIYTGIDQHRRSSVLTTVTAQGERLEQVTLPNDRGLLVQYFARFPSPHHAVVEATGRWYWLRDLLHPQGIDLHLAHAKFLKAIAYAKVKTDAVDSDTLAQLLRTGLIPEAHMIAEAQRGPRDVLRARLRLVERRSRCKNSFDRLLEKFNVLDVTALPPLYQLQAQLHTAQIALLTDQIRTLEQAIQGDLLETPAIQRLLWIPGIGRIVAFTLALEVGDIQRFPPSGTSGPTAGWSQGLPTPGAAIGTARAKTATATSSWPSVTPRCGRSSTSPRCGSGTSAGSARSPADSAGPGGQGAGPERVCGAPRRGGVPPAVQRHAAHTAETNTVAPAGKPPRLTELDVELQCLIGKPVGHAEVRIWDAEDILRSARRNARSRAPNGV